MADWLAKTDVQEDYVLASPAPLRMQPWPCRPERNLCRQRSDLLRDWLHAVPQMPRSTGLCSQLALEP